MGRANRRSGAMWRGFVALAALALLVQVLVPQGFMVGAAGSTPGLVICTGHGPLLSLDSPSHPGKAPKSSSDAPCGFAAHGAGAAPPSPISVAEASYAIIADIVAQHQKAALDRGLAAPPPPSHAPPVDLV